ncbi:hypothetical protein [Neoactinobaculum massilliense]|uniref:hypothetical protein n=1 Tax=Neoactinobaculum massilliense TaxID=2364794 RepID=UPI000F544C1B|nr:hypothetical protein [Neoactinobaculum massilliense]
MSDTTWLGFGVAFALGLFGALSQWHGRKEIETDGEVVQRAPKRMKVGGIVALIASVFGLVGIVGSIALVTIDGWNGTDIFFLILCGVLGSFFAYMGWWCLSYYRHRALIDGVDEATVWNVRGRKHVYAHKDVVKLASDRSGFFLVFWTCEGEKSRLNGGWMDCSNLLRDCALYAVKVPISLRDSLTVA